MLYWKPENFLVGIDIIDRQHQTLFEAINRFHTAMMQSPEKPDLAEMLKYLRSYVDNHFRDEEELMNQYQYPGLDQQRIEHEHFKEDLDKFEDMVRDEGSSMKTLLTIYSRLSNWLAVHVSELDRRMGEYIAGRMKTE